MVISYNSFAKLALYNMVHSYVPQTLHYKTGLWMIKILENQQVKIKYIACQKQKKFDWKTD